MARIFNIYDPRMHPNAGRVVSYFIVLAERNELITLYGDGTQTRSFCYVDDLFEGFVCRMDGDDGFAGLVNLSNPGEFSMIELAEKVKELTGSHSELVHHPLPQDEPRQRRPDILLARDRLGWRPQVVLAESLKPMIEYFDALLRIDDYADN